MDTIGEKIHKLRKSSGKSQEELALELGVSRQTVYKWESEYVQPNAENISALCELFQLDKSYFYDDNTVAANGENVIVKHKDKTKKWTILTIIFTIALCVAIFVTVCLKDITNPVNSGDEVVKVYNVDISIFYFSLVLSCILAVCDIIFIAYMLQSLFLKKSNKM
ncbi:MAG: helix-turn-helix domain-containing protein [Ruminococcus flavefaciens]|nr:helix-turn-helix domain-containing protein [Ruminococcus flavefaciens]